MSNELSDGDGSKPPRILWMHREEPDRPKRPWYQFTLAGLLTFVTIACIIFAILGAFGMKGTAERIGAALFFASPFEPLIEILLRWWISEQESRTSSTTSNSPTSSAPAPKLPKE